MGSSTECEIVPKGGMLRMPMPEMAESGWASSLSSLSSSHSSSIETGRCVSSLAFDFERCWLYVTGCRVGGWSC